MKKSNSILQTVEIDPLLNIKQVCALLSVGKTTFYQYIGTIYPTPVQISPRRVGWRASEINALLAGLKGKGGAA